MDNVELENLVKQAQQGKSQAFERLLQEHYAMMYRVAFKWCGHKENAEDITQNACIKLARSINSFKFKSSFSTWLYRLVINTAKDWAKSQNRHRGQELTESGHIGAVKHTPEDSLYAREILAQVLDLPEKEKNALLLVFAEGMSHAEAADVMNVKESTVSWYIHEARKKLADFKQEEHSHG